MVFDIVIYNYPSAPTSIVSFTDCLYECAVLLSSVPYVNVEFGARRNVMEQ